MKISAQAAERLSKFDPTGTVFSEFTALSLAHNSVNLGQGFPTVPVPQFVKDSASHSIQKHDLMNQYTRSEGHIKLVDALAKFYSPKLNREINPKTEIITTVGATEAIFITMQALISPGDEVILIQPFYDSYPASVIMAGGTPVFVDLEEMSKVPGQRSSKNWTVNLANLESKITAKTKMLVLNNPHNPIGKVFQKQFLEELAALINKHDILVLADEVYETLVYDHNEFHKFASIKGMFKNTVTVGSVGKMFNVTGWKIGWIIAPAELVRAIWLVHQFSTFCIATAFQEATAECLELAEKNGYFEENLKLYETNRDMLVNVLRGAGLDPVVPEAGYFVMADTSSVKDVGEASTGEKRRDYRVCKTLTVDAGVTAIPPSAFFEVGSKGWSEVAGYLARFAFCKNDEMMQEASVRLKKFFAN